MSKMYRDDISDEAIDVLSDLFMLLDYSKAQKKTLEYTVNEFLSQFTIEEANDYTRALKELGDRKFIFIKYGDSITSTTEQAYEKIIISPKGRAYHYKFLERTGRYSMKRSEHEKTVDDAIKKLTNSATYILITAILSALVDLINALVNIYNALH